MPTYICAAVCECVQCICLYLCVCKCVFKKLCWHRTKWKQKKNTAIVVLNWRVLYDATFSKMIANLCAVRVGGGGGRCCGVGQVAQQQQQLKNLCATWSQVLRRIVNLLKCMLNNAVNGRTLDSCRSAASLTASTSIRASNGFCERNENRF